MKIKLTMISTINYPQTDNYVAILLPSLTCHLESLMKIYFWYSMNVSEYITLCRAYIVV